MQTCCKKTPFLYESKTLPPFSLQQAPFEMSTQDLNLRVPPLPVSLSSSLTIMNQTIRPGEGEGCWIIGKFLSLLMIKENAVHHSPLHSIQALLHWTKHKENKASLKGRWYYTKLCSVIFQWQVLPAQGAWSRPCLTCKNHPVTAFLSLFSVPTMSWVWISFSWWLRR